MIAVDLCTFTASHAGGKDEVAYNLLRGWVKHGYYDSFVCICYAELVPVVEGIDKRINTFVISKKANYKSELQKIIDQSGVSCVLFTNKPTPRCKLQIPSAVIPHDVQVFLSDKIPGIHYRCWGLRSKLSIFLDFYFRDHIIAISDYDKSIMEKNLPWCAAKIHRIYDPIKFISGDSSEQKKYITALNIQWKHKNVETLIRAFIKVADKIHYNLVLLGKKPSNYPELEALIVESGLSERIKFTGFISEEELERYISQTAIYVNPSFFEGFGMTAVEMMGKGIPTIVADTTASPEVTLGLCRYYSPANDVEALAYQIEDECTHPTPLDKLSLIAQTVKDKYSYESISEEYWLFLKKVSECKEVI